MRNKYERKLMELKAKTQSLCGLVLSALKATLEVMKSGDKELAEKIVEGDDAIDNAVKVVERDCFSILLTEQPVACDLRKVSGTLKMLTDLERVGDYCVDLAEMTERVGKSDYGDLGAMGQAVADMLELCNEAFDEMSTEKAREVALKDDIADDLFLKVRIELAGLIRIASGEAEYALDLMNAAKYLERIGDHVTNIAEFIIYIEEGVVSEIN